MTNTETLIYKVIEIYLIYFLCKWTNSYQLVFNHKSMHPGRFISFYTYLCLFMSLIKGTLNFNSKGPVELIYYKLLYHSYSN